MRSEKESSVEDKSIIENMTTAMDMFSPDYMENGRELSDRELIEKILYAEKEIKERLKEMELLLEILCKKK